MSEEEQIPKQRIAIYTKKGITTRIEYNPITDEQFEKNLTNISTSKGIEKDSILTYTLGDEDEMENGNLYFCPRCGHHNEYAYEPDLRMFYAKDKETDELKEAGYYKFVTIDCSGCDETFEIHSKKMDEDAQKFTKSIMGDKKEVH